MQSFGLLQRWKQQSDLTLANFPGPGTSLKKPGTGIGAPTPGVRYGRMLSTWHGNLL